METLAGIVQRVTFHNEENGWSVLKVSPFKRPGETITVTLHQVKVFAGATAEFQGEWVQHPKYGNQFKANKFTERKPASAGALEKYLGSGLIYGVGPKTAKKIVRHFGDKTLNIFEEDIDRLTEVRGIAKAKLAKIQAAWLEHREIRNVMLFLQTYDISTLFAVKIYKQYGDSAISVVKENPYQLAKDIYGIGFHSADQMAMRLGIGVRSEIRIQAAIRYLLTQAREDGHCYLTYQQILERLNHLLGDDFTNELAQQLELLSLNNEIKSRTIKKDNAEASIYYANSLFFDELLFAKKIHSLNQVEITFDQERIKNWLTKYNETREFPLSTEQMNAVEHAAVNPVSVLTGGPGCGKTTSTKALVKLLLAMKKKIILAAPTGRAAQRMMEVMDREAKTIHRLLEFNPSSGGFKKNEDNPLEADFLILDECSMLDITLACSLLKAVQPPTQVLFIGDKDQLPSVGAGNVLGDLIESNYVSVIRLTQIFRQAQESQIIQYAHSINRGITPKVDGPFRKPSLWKTSDVLFIDAEEATQKDLKFLKSIKRFIYQDENDQKLYLKNEQYYDDEGNLTDLGEEDVTNRDNPIFNINQNFKHVDVKDIIQSKRYTEEVKSVLKKIHPHSCLNYGRTASQMIEELYFQSIKKYLGDAEIQILCPMIKGNLGTAKINQLIQGHKSQQFDQYLEIANKRFQIDDRVIQRRNNYDLEVYNGDIGIIKEIDFLGPKLYVQFSGPDQKIVCYEKEAMNELDLAYAITIHKSQGSEFDVVIIPVTTQHFKMLFRNLIYTGLTRAKKLAIFIGTRKALTLAIRNLDARKRQTYLKELLQELSN